MKTGRRGDVQGVFLGEDLQAQPQAPEMAALSR